MMMIIFPLRDYLNNHLIVFQVIQIQLKYKRIPTDLTSLRINHGCFFFMKFSKSVTILEDQAVRMMNQPNDFFSHNKYINFIYSNTEIKK